MEENLAKALMEVPIFGKKRRPVSAEDFGDVETIGLHLKRKGVGESYQDHDFGVYLGHVKNGYGVATMEVMSFIPTKLETYATLDALHREWRLD